MSINRIQHLIPESARAEMATPESAAQFQKGQDFLRSILHRSTTDEGFRTQILTTPRDAIAAYYKDLHGEESTIPQVDVRFVENQGDMTLVLPPFVDPDAELSDAELQTVAGGDSGATAVSVSVAIAASNAACVGFVAGVATVVLITWALSD